MARAPPRDLPVGELSHSDSLRLLQRHTSVLELLDPVTATLHHGAAPSLPVSYAVAIDGMSIGPDEGSCGSAAYLGTPVVAADITTDPRWAGFRDLAWPHGLRSCWSTPICGRAGTSGTFAVYHDCVHQPTPRRLRQVVINLITNAIRYNKPEGQVEVGVAAAAHGCAIRVTDTGPGIDPGLFERLFIPFDRLGAESSPEQGTGLGLPLARGLTEAMGGHLAINSEPGMGTTSTVILPRGQVRARNA